MAALEPSFLRGEALRRKGGFFGGCFIGEPIEHRFNTILRELGGIHDGLSTGAVEPVVGSVTFLIVHMGPPSESCT